MNLKVKEVGVVRSEQDNLGRSQRSQSATETLDIVLEPRRGTGRNPGGLRKPSANAFPEEGLMASAQAGRGLPASLRKAPPEA